MARHADNDNRRPRNSVRPACLTAAIALARGRDATIALRLDPARHMRLRLACALHGRSAEGIVREALDAHLGTMPEVERLVAAAMAEGGDEAATGRGTDR